MPPSRTFDMPARLAAKADPRLIADDETHFATVAGRVEQSIAELADQLDAERRAPGGSGQEAMDRDLQVHRLTARLRVLRRFGLDVCLGRMVAADGATVYVGRLGLTDAAGEPLLVDWRSPAAEPFFAATHADPRGLVSRRRYRWTDGRITDYWDEVFTAEGLDEEHAALDDQSAFLAGLGASRSARMRDVLATIQADQDAIIRAGSSGTLVVDGGPGTGKTVVALHRAAYLLYTDPRLDAHHGGVLVVGPHQPYLDYVADVLPGLGEDGVRTCTLRHLVTEGRTAREEPDPDAARLKASAEMVGSIEAAVGLYEEPPTSPLTVETPWADLRLTTADWANAFGAAPAGMPHNDARDAVWSELLAILSDRLPDDDNGDGTSSEAVRAVLVHDAGLVAAFGRAWPLLDAAEVVGDLWTVPAYLRRCAPWLTREEIHALQRPDPQAWTVSDLPLLDAARRRIGDRDAARRRRRHAAAVAERRAQMAEVVDDLIASDDSELMVMSMLRGGDLQRALVDDAAGPAETPDRLAGPFAHVVVDEAQELTDAEWQMLFARCPSRSFTVVGDRAQARSGFPETWSQRLERVGLGCGVGRGDGRRDGVGVASLTVNYRTPEEVMAQAEPVIRAVLPDANVPTSVRRSGRPVERGAVSQLAAIVDRWAVAHAGGIACVVGDPTFAARERVRSLPAPLTKGLEFDLVVLVEPDGWGESVAASVDRYVAMTRATQQLVILSG